MRRLLLVVAVLFGCLGFHAASASASPVPTSWCNFSYETWTTYNPGSANAASVTSCAGPIASVEADVSLFQGWGQSNVGNNDDYEANSSYAQAVVTDYCDWDSGGCNGDNPWSSWEGGTFLTNRGWWDDGGGITPSGGNCWNWGNYISCQVSPGWYWW